MNKNLMDFQRSTAERIVHIYKDLHHRRVLLADEVGLGKTFVAKQVVSLVKQWHKAVNDDFFKVVYICSNANIASQNMGKLGIKEQMSISEGRLSMQHLNIKLQEKNIKKLTDTGEMPELIIPITPATSFQFRNTRGTAAERALMYCLLRGMPEFNTCKEKLSEFLRCDVKEWKDYISRYEWKIKKCGEDYRQTMHTELRTELSKEDHLSQVLDCIKKGCDKTERSKEINILRHAFAEISVGMLEPDLIIMDEFQRFSSLLEKSDDEQSMLTKKFFDEDSKSGKEHEKTKILLLSATPYKPYSTLEELNTDGTDTHYKDFENVTNFLFMGNEKTDEFKSVWHDFSTALKRAEADNLLQLKKAKDAAQEMLYEVMCRTERLNKGIIDDKGVTEIQPLREDILSYAQCQGLMDCLSKRKCESLANENNDRCGDIDTKPLGNVPTEYVKSSPYLLSFMDKYVLKKRIADDIRIYKPQETCETSALLLSKRSIDTYRPIAAANGKLKYLHDLVFGKEQEKKTQFLLWVPASNPYYKAGGLFESKEAKDFSKILLFSSWEMVPRMISVMMSYYGELYTFGKLNNGRGKIRYTSEESYGGNRLQKNELLEYPCKTLAGMYAPAEFFGKELRDIKNAVKQRIEMRLKERENSGLARKKVTKNAGNLLSLMKTLDGEIKDDTSNWDVSKNALEVLADIAIASPAVCAYRQSHDTEDATKVAEAIVSIFNKPESAAIIDLLYKQKKKSGRKNNRKTTRKNRTTDKPYYENVLDYCAMGNLQAVLDEYAHIATSETGKLGDVSKESIIGTSNLSIDTDKSLFGDEEKLKMRCHLAIPLIDKTITDKTVSRTDNIRKAFNSPFRPFILSTTSIGQEGLDFHYYARKVVHWNLPSNPVDLEQREGRVNRFECLAIRRNIAKLYGRDAYHPWDKLFAIASEQLKGDNSDIVPYWCLPIDKLTDSQRRELEYIERIVPIYPLSYDVYKYERLIKVLALYRMTLGQPRQEELLDLLQNSLTDEELQELTIDLCPLNREKALQKQAQKTE